MKRSSAIIAIVVVVVLIAAGVAVYKLETAKKAPINYVIEGSAKSPGHLDPAVTFSTAGWEIMNQIYQGMVAPNGTSETSYIGVLATNWTVSNNNMSYTFTLRQGVTFSNGNPYNAYVQWYSMYRTLIMNQAPSFILGQNFNYSNGVNFTVTPTDLNTFNFSNPTSSQLSIMEYPYQSFQVIDNHTIRLNLGYGYNGDVPFNALLATLSTPPAAAVDPIFVDAHGGVSGNNTNSYMTTNTMGTGPFYLQKYVPSSTAVLEKSPTYWANNLSNSSLNYAIQPAKLNEVIIDYQPVSTSISAAKAGKLQVIDAPSSSYYSTLKGISGFNTSILPVRFGSSEGTYYVYMDPASFSAFTNLDVRMAITYAINYTGIISTVYHGLASPWIGPVPAGFPYYNRTTSGLSPYSYDPVKAAHLLAEAGYRATLPNGTVLNSGGSKFPTATFTFDVDSSSQTSEAQIIIADLEAIGIPITSDGVSHSTWESIIFGTNANSTTHYFGISYYTEDYTATEDYVDAILDEGYVGASGYGGSYNYNSTIFNMTVNATSTNNPTYIVQNYTNIVRDIYNSYWFAWLNVPYMLAFHSDNLAGIIPNPAGSAAGYFMFWNDVYYT